MIPPQHIAKRWRYGLVPHLLDLRLSLCDRDEKARINFEQGLIWKRLGADAIEVAAEVVSLVWVTFSVSSRQQSIGQFFYA